MEGAPGSGKSTLSLHICHQWRDAMMFNEYKLVILVKLRDSTVHNATGIYELLPRQNEIMGNDIANVITRNNGKGVLFVLDGWDELPRNCPGYSVIKDLITGEQLQECAIIITSRPASSVQLHSLTYVRIEILGFTRNELKLYFSACLEENIIAVNTLLRRIKENPIIEGSCYLPLNASILVHLFKCGGNTLPNTLYEIFTELVCNCILRHLMKTQQEIVALKSLDDLPPAVDTPFQKLCEIAYQGIINDRVVFDLDSSVNTLGLLQGVESFAVHGKSHCYNFLHLSVQELLAAIYFAMKLDAEEQIQQFKRLFKEPRFSAVFQFFAAKTKLQTLGIQSAIKGIARSNKKALLLSLLHCLSGSWNSSLCQIVVQELNYKLGFGDSFDELGERYYGISLNPADCYVLGHFLVYCKDFEIDLTNCSIGDDGCKSLLREDKIYNIKTLKLQGNSITDEGIAAMKESMKTMIKLQNLSLKGNFIGDEGAAALSDAMKKMINLQTLDLQVNSIQVKGAEAISDALKVMTYLWNLNLEHNNIGDKGAVAISDGLNTLTSLEDLNLGHNHIGDIGAIAISKALKTMTHLFKLNIQDNSIGDRGIKSLSKSIMRTKLVILNLRNNCICNEGAMGLSEELMTLTDLMELDLTWNTIGKTGREAIKTAVKYNILKRLMHGSALNMSDSDIIEATKVMTVLQALFFYHDAIYDVARKALLITRTRRGITAEIPMIPTPKGILIHGLNSQDIVDDDIFPQAEC